LCGGSTTHHSVGQMSDLGWQEEDGGFNLLAQCQNKKEVVVVYN